MNTRRIFPVICLTALLVGEALWPAVAAAQAHGMTMQLAAADCYAVGQRLAAETGGQLARATPATRDGQPVCRIVILVPGRDGERPRRAEYVVPAE
jgi:hypothetical protein